ncbi:MAG: hypothetical protein ACRDJM_01510, partial [Actinomycetota bacterium]
MHRAMQKARGRFDLQVLAEVARMRLGSSLGRHVPSPYDRIADLPAGGARAGQVETYTDRYQFDAGDLNADGSGDVLNLDFTYEIDFDLGEFRVLANLFTAFSGATGAVLWTRDYGAIEFAFPAGFGDFDGDGTGDVLMIALTDDGSTGISCAVVACAGVAEIRAHWTIDAVAGAGTQMWSKRYDALGTVTEVAAFALVADGILAIVDIANYSLFPVVSGDHDADGGADIAINAADLKEVFVLTFAGFFAGAAVFAFPYLLTVRGTLVSGADAAPILSRTAENSSGAALLPAGNAVGSATTDVLWSSSQTVASPVACVFALVTAVCAGTQRSTITLEMIDGATKATAWTLVRDDPLIQAGFVEALRADPTGDGKTDLLLAEFTPLGLRQGVVSGAAGTLEWMITTDAYLFPTGAIGGEPGADLLGLFVEYEFGNVFTIRMRIDRVDGGTGALLSQTEHSYSDDDTSWVDAFLFLAGDTDGDGVSDVGIDVIRYNFDGGPDRSISFVESGADGSTVFDRQGDGILILLPAGDADADGDADLLDLALEYFGGGTMALRAMPAGSVQWTLPEPNVLYTLTPVRDLFGTGGDDLLSLVYDRNYQKSRFDVVDQRAGARVWGHGDPIAPPPPGTTGAIAGTVT